MKLPLIASLAVATVLSTAVFAQTRPAPAAPSAMEASVASALTRLQRFADEDALRTLGYRYGRGLDALSVHYADRATGRALATREYAQAFAPDVRIKVFPLRGTTPLREVTGIDEWVAFADGFFEANRYSSTVHLMSNFGIVWRNADTPVVSSYAIVPHFIRAAARDAGAAETSLEVMVGRYEYVGRRQADGGWRIAEMTVHLDEIWRTGGFYPNGQAPGR